MFARIVTLALFCAALAAEPAPAGSRSTPIPVTATALAIFGQWGPDSLGSFGTYSSFGEPLVNDSGQVVFSAHVSGAGVTGANDGMLVRAEPDGKLHLIAREGQFVPDSTGRFGDLFSSAAQNYSMGNSGRVAFYAPLIATAGGTADNTGIFSAAGFGSTTYQHARRGQVAPGAGGSAYSSFFAPPTTNHQVPAAVAFYATTGTSSYPAGLLGGARGTATWTWALAGWPLPAGGLIQQFYDSDPPAIDPFGSDVAVWTHALFGPDVVLHCNDAGWSEIARGGKTGPFGLTYQALYGPVLNMQGNAAFMANISPYPSAGDAVVIAGDGSDDLADNTNRELPDTSGYFSYLDHPALTNGNQAAFRADLKSTPLGSLDDSGIYRGDGTILIQAAREGAPAPDGNGSFGAFGHVVGINNQGRILFTATLRGTAHGSADNFGVYLWDEQYGLTKILRTGDALGGHTVQGFSVLSMRDYDGLRWLNDAAYVVARVNLGGVGDGIYEFRPTFPVAVGSAPRTRPALLTAGPNPSRGGNITIRYALPPGAPAGRIRLTLHDAQGRRVRSILDGPAAAGAEIRWNPSSGGGEALAAGVYFLRLEAAGASASRRLIRLP